jgi:hypothetical protein
MSVSGAQGLRRRWTMLVGIAVFFTCVALAWGQGPPSVVKVEQDWELVLNIPDPESDAPQVVCVISPVGNVAGLHAAFELNQQSLPSFAAGGLQLQVWEGEEPLEEKNAADGVILDQPEEIISWTQAMELRDGKLRFAVRNGVSITWGAFGKEDSLAVGVPTCLTSLDCYDSAVSVRNSGVAFATNRVRSLTLKRVRLHLANGDVVEDAVPKVVYSQRE